jgi:hypothetical protein
MGYESHSSFICLAAAYPGMTAFWNQTAALKMSTMGAKRLCRRDSSSLRSAVGGTLKRALSAPSPEDQSLFPIVAAEFGSTCNQHPEDRRAIVVSKLDQARFGDKAA